MPTSCSTKKRRRTLKAELSCDDARVELSARLDGEVDRDTEQKLDDHLGSCAGCREHEADLARVRRALRAYPAETVPDLSERILERVGSEAAKDGVRAEWRTRARIAGIAAAAAALLLIGSSLPWVRQPGDSASAAEIARAVRAAARALQAYEARFQITERGWHRDIPVRHFSAEVSYRAPERFRLSIRDETLYPGPYGWPQNNVDVIANERRWWIREPSSCPSVALPGCAVPTGVEERTVVERQPFDGTSSLPTDIILPVETLATSAAFRVIGERRVLGRTAYEIALPYRQAAPLVAAMQAGGSWRVFRPSDRVHMWIDQQTWFPLRFEVRARSSSKSRPALSVRATTFSQPRTLREDIFRAPKAGIVKSGGFQPKPFGALAARYRPSYLAGLQRYRAGVTDRGQRILAYAHGMTWLKQVIDRRRPGSSAYLSSVEEVELAKGRFAYYEPATIGPNTTSLSRRVHIYSRDAHIYLESNLPRAELLEVARSVHVAGDRLPTKATVAGGLVVERLTLKRVSALAFAELPRYVPPGHRFSAASLSHFGPRSRTVAVYFRNPEADYDGFGIRVMHSPSIDFLAPSSERLRPVRIDRTIGRWSEERSELEWIDDGVYRAVAGPSFDLRTLLRVARSLR